MDAKPYKIPYPFKKLSRDLIDRIVTDIEEGSTRKLASLSNGITPRIFDIWQKQGEIDIEHEQYDSLCAYMVLSLSKVRQKEVKHCRSVIKMCPKGHAGAQWTLEHAYWREYGNNAPVMELAAEIEKFKADQLTRSQSDGEVNSEEA